MADKASVPKRLFVVEQDDGQFSGYMRNGDEYTHVFDSNKHLLFMNVKCYVDHEVRRTGIPFGAFLVDSEHKEEFLKIVEEKSMKESKELLVVNRGDGWYGGYIKRNGNYEQVFNTGAELLFASIKPYGEKNYPIKFIDGRQAEDFMKGRVALEQYLDQQTPIDIWRPTPYSPFQFGPKQPPMKTTINPFDYEICGLHKGYAAVVIRSGGAKGVYELKSGALVGDTVEMVNADIDACEDMSVMDGQIADAMRIRDGRAVYVTNAEFGLSGKEEV